MLLTVQGYFEAGRFVTDTPMNIPERRKTIVTVLDEKIEETDWEAHKDLWGEIIDEIKNSDEVLEGEPERLRFKSPEEIDSL